ncbi:SDR family oxidoreductase [Noviherbaspirillum sp. ST9]|uniref:SDR family oxidoreductase n=1 Tax=Noviherbaspirillum sp. ST9 TaxID=3401606 RepID=UPI003B588BBC
MKAILTGHTRGLGAAIAGELLGRHIPVLGLARRRNADLAQRFPVGLEQVELDLADTGSLEDWLAGDTLATFLAGSPSVVLINNAGVVQPVGPLGAQDILSIARAVALNVAAPLMLSRAVTAASPAAHDWRILHVSSGAARNAYPGWSVYCATKAALDHHARAVALDKVPGLRICSLAPGVIDTDMQTEIRSTPMENFPLRERFEAMKRDGALTSPEDCARRLVDYLLDARFGEMPVADLRDFAS